MIPKRSPRWSPRDPPDDPQEIPQMIPKRSPRWSPRDPPDDPQEIPIFSTLFSNFAFCFQGSHQHFWPCCSFSKCKAVVTQAVDRLTKSGWYDTDWYRLIQMIGYRLIQQAFFRVSMNIIWSILFEYIWMCLNCFASFCIILIHLASMIGVGWDVVK